MCADSARARLTEYESRKPIESKDVRICRLLSLSFLQNAANTPRVGAPSRDERLQPERRGGARGLGFDRVGARDSERRGARLAARNAGDPGKRASLLPAVAFDHRDALLGGRRKGM